MTPNEFFEHIKSTYGVSPDTLRNIWEKTRVDNHTNHVKRFKHHLEQFYGEIPRLGHEILPDEAEAMAEAVARVFLAVDVAELEEEIAYTLENQ